MPHDEDDISPPQSENPGISVGLTGVAARRFGSACARDADDLARAIAEEREAEAKLADARLGRAGLETEQLSRSLAHTQRISSLEARLRAGASELIDRFITDLDILFDDARRGVQILGSPDRERDELTGTLLDATLVTNAPSVRRRLEAIGAAQVQAAALKLGVDVSEDAVKTHLRELLAEIPEIEPALRAAGRCTQRANCGRSPGA